MNHSCRLSFAFPLLCFLSFFGVAHAQSAEQQFWEMAREANTIEALKGFVEVFPDSEFSAEANIMVEDLQRADTQRETEDKIFELVGQVFYDKPLEFGHPAIQGQTLRQVIESKPIFPPIEGLPESLWKNETCSKCHSWDRASLCEQGRFYGRIDPAEYQFKKHPFGGSLKINLRNWVAADCR